MGLASLRAVWRVSSLLLHGSTQPEGRGLQARKRALTRNQITQQLNLGLPVSTAVKNKCLLFKLLSLWQPEQTKTVLSPETTDY